MLLPRRSSDDDDAVEERALRRDRVVVEGAAVDDDMTTARDGDVDRCMSARRRCSTLMARAKSASTVVVDGERP